MMWKMVRNTVTPVFPLAVLLPWMAELKMLVSSMSVAIQIISSLFLFAQFSFADEAKGSLSEANLHLLPSCS